MSHLDYDQEISIYRMMVSCWVAFLGKIHDIC